MVLAEAVPMDSKYEPPRCSNAKPKFQHSLTSNLEGDFRVGHTRGIRNVYAAIMPSYKFRFNATCDMKVLFEKIKDCRQGGRNQSIFY